jgi:hypothetical protein
VFADKGTHETYLTTDGYLRYHGGDYVHRVIVEEALRKKLPVGAVVHHIDYDRTNNNTNNLIVCQNQAYHKLLHALQRVVDLGGDPNLDAYCSYHQCLHRKELFSPVKKRWNALNNRCREATNEYRRLRGLNRDKFDWRARLNQQYRRILNRYTSKGISWLNEE